MVSRQCCVAGSLIHQQTGFGCLVVGQLLMLADWQLVPLAVLQAFLCHLRILP